MSDISKEYGEALFALGLETNSLDQIDKDLKFISEIFEKAPEYKEFLQSPSIKKSERLSTINETFENNISEYALSFISILCEKGRAGIFTQCADEFQKLYAESKKVSIARVKTTVPLDENQKEQLKAKLEKQSGHSVVLECSIDKTLLGGVLIEIDGILLDGTLKHRLQELKEVMDK